MRAKAIDTTSTNRRPKQPWVSRSSILILSGTLIGYGVQLPLSSLMHVCILGAGVVGLGAFLALDIVARQRQKQLRERLLVEMNWTLESRIHKHIPKQHALSTLQRRCLRGDRSYLSVVRD